MSGPENGEAYTNTKRKFLPVEIDFLVNTERTKLFTEVRYQKKHEAILPTHKFDRGARSAYFRSGCPQKGWIVHRSKSKKNLTKDNFSRLYHNCIKEYRPFNFSSILTRSGYRYYCDLEPGNLHHLCYSLMALFFVGTIARYRPTTVDTVLTGAMRPLVTEALSLCPQQFLYQIASLTTKSMCVVPYAKV